MYKAPVSSNEKERLALIRSLELLGSPPEKVYDDIVKIAASLTGAKYAAFTVLGEDRQWLKAKIGTEVNETPRDIAFCAYTILEYKPLIVENTSNDARFAEHPAVTGDEPIHTYAGFPVKGDTKGTIIGALCIYHDQPLPLSDDQIAVMELLAKQIEEHLNYRHVLHELTEINQEKNELQTHLEKILKEKDHLLAHLSHEIRNPLNAIMGLADLLEETALDDYQAEVLNQLRHSQEFLLLLLNDILDFSKINAKEVHLKISDVNLKDLVHEITSLYRPRAIEKKLDLSYEIHTTIQSLPLDNTRVKQVLGNLIFNAIKFTDQGRIKVSVNETVDQCVFSVEDTGIGIQKEFQKRIFNDYAQDEKYQRVFHGTGLGLSISKSLIELMGGSINFKSPIYEENPAYGPGSKFYFSIPKPSHLSNGGAVREELPQKDILVVDDDRLATELLVRKLSKLQHKVTEVNRGKDAIQLVKEKDFDLIILDSNMPFMDGRDIFEEIRKVKNGNLPVIICSGYTHEEFRNSYRKIGPCQFLTKPFLTEQLQDAMVRAFNPKS